MEAAVVTVAAGIFIGLIGFLIRYRGMNMLIAGYSPEKFEDEEELSVFIGSWTLRVSALTVLVGLVEHLRIFEGSIHWTFYTAFVGAAAVYMVYGSNRYR